MYRTKHIASDVMPVGACKNVSILFQHFIEEALVCVLYRAPVRCYSASLNRITGWSTKEEN